MLRNNQSPLSLGLPIEKTLTKGDLTISTIRESDALLGAENLLGSRLVGGGDVVLQGHQLLVDGIEEPAGLREEALLQLVARGDPVA